MCKTGELYWNNNNCPNSWTVRIVISLQAAFHCLDKDKHTHTRFMKLSKQLSLMQGFTHSNSDSNHT